MSIKSILTVLIIFGMQSTLMAYGQHALSPPMKSSENARLLEFALSTHKTLYEKINELTLELEKSKQSCDKDIIEKSQTCGSLCSGEPIDEIKSNILDCMTSFFSTATSIDRNRLEVVKFTYQINSGLYDDMSAFRDSLLLKLIALNESYKSINKHINELANSYSKQYKSILMNQFAKTKLTGTFLGTIKGTCIVLKNEIDVQKAFFKLISTKNSYTESRLFYNKIKGYHLLSNSIRDLCPPEFKPDDYGPFLAEIDTYLKSIFKEKSVISECARPKIKEYVGKDCHSAILVDPYFIGVLSEVKK